MNNIAPLNDPDLKDALLEVLRASQIVSYGHIDATREALERALQSIRKADQRLTAQGEKA